MDCHRPRGREPGRTGRYARGPIFHHSGIFRYNGAVRHTAARDRICDIGAIPTLHGRIELERTRKWHDDRNGCPIRTFCSIAPSGTKLLQPEGMLSEVLHHGGGSFRFGRVFVSGKKHVLGFCELVRSGLDVKEGVRPRQPHG
jgi:hypothetical protein